jgi:hypothetical protein
MAGNWVSKRMAADQLRISVHSVNTLISRYHIEERRGVDQREKLIDLDALRAVLAELPKKAERV